MKQEKPIDISGIEAVRKGQGIDEIIQNPMSYALYAQTLNGLSRRLTVGESVPDDVDIAVIGNNTLLPSVLSLRPLDKEPLEGVDRPGKSCHIEHTRSIAIACLTMLGRVAKREDHLYRMSAKELRLLGLIPVYAPTVRRPLHVRLIPTYYQKEDIPEAMKIAFTKLINDGHHKVPQDPLRRGVRKG